MTTCIKSNFLLKTVILIAALIVIVCVDCSSANSKPTMDSSVVTADRSMDTNFYQQISPTGDRLNKIESPANISNHKIILFKDDRSCGSAALATILKYSFNVDVNEMNVITGMLTYGDRESIVKRSAFSFYDMKRFLASIGYTGTGYKIDGQISSEQFNNDDFDTIRNTTIIPIEVSGYSHFTVYRAFDDQYVYLGSPLYGNICVTFDDLSKVIIKRSIFVISKRESEKL